MEREIKIMKGIDERAPKALWQEKGTHATSTPIFCHERENTHDTSHILTDKTIALQGVH